MKKEVIVSAATIDEAINKAAAELNVDKIDCSIEVLETPRRAILFGKAKAAVIKATVEIEEPKAAPIPEPEIIKKQAEARTEPMKSAATPHLESPRGGTSPELSKKPAAARVKTPRVKPEAAVCSEKIGVAQGYLRSILDTMGLSDVAMEVTEEQEGATISFNGEGIAVLIGHHGETLDALQYLVALNCNRSDGEYYRISLDCGSYREKREVTLQALAERIAAKAKKTGRSQLLEPMNPYERRIIHAVVSEIDGVFSRSKGEEPNRRVVILNETPAKTFARPNTNTARPQGENSNRTPQSARPQGNRPPHSARPQGENSSNRPPHSARPQGENSSNRPPHSARPQGENNSNRAPHSTRPQGEKHGFSRDDHEIKPGAQHKPERSMEEILKNDFKKREESAELYSKIEI